MRTEMNPILLLASAATLLCISCGSSDKQRPADNGGIPPAETDAITLTLTGDDKEIEDYILGFNTQSIKGPGWDKAEFYNRIEELNPGNFRYPGGTVGNFWDWKSGYYNDIGKQVKPVSPSSSGPFPYKIDHVRTVYQRTGAQPVYMLNMLTSNLEDQLEMLRYAKSIGLPVEFVEMGNEFYLDDHPEEWPYLNVFPETTDYTKMCREWTTAIHNEFPEARIALIGVTTPANWTKRPRAQEWNNVVMKNMDGIVCHAITLHNYPKNSLENPKPYDMVGQVLNSVKQDKLLDPSIDSKYKLWFTEYNFESSSNPFPGQWIHGLVAALMSSRLIATPRVEMLCFFNLTAGKSSSAIFDDEMNIAGEKAPKYALSATGETLKLLQKAVRGSSSVRMVSFSSNPKVSTQKQGQIETLYGYMYGASQPRLMILNFGEEEQNISLDGLDFNPTSFEQIAAPSLETAIAGSSSLTRLNRNIGSTKQVLLRPYSMTVIR